MNLFKTIKCIGTIHSCGTGNIQLFKTYEIEIIDNKYLNLVIVHLKHIQFISGNTEVLPVLIIYDKYASC